MFFHNYFSQFFAFNIHHFGIAENSRIYFGHLTYCPTRLKGRTASGRLGKGLGAAQQQYPAGEGHCSETKANRPHEHDRAAQIIWWLIRRVSGCNWRRDSADHAQLYTYHQSLW